MIQPALVVFRIRQTSVRLLFHRKSATKMTVSSATETIWRMRLKPAELYHGE